MRNSRGISYPDAIRSSGSRYIRTRPAAAVATMGSVGIMSLILAAFSPSPVVILAAGMTMIIIVALLWTGKDFPFLLFAVAYQWSTISVKPVLTAFTGQPINDLAQFDGNLEAGVLFSLAGILALSVGLKIGAGRPRGNPLGTVRAEVMRMSFRRILIIALGAVILGHVLYNLSGYTGPARQIFLAFANVKLAGIFVLAYWCFTKRRGYFFLAGLLIFEIAAGMVGFFADFRGPVLMVFLAAISARPNLRLSDMILASTVASVILTAAVFWTTIKGGYREFVNLGTGQQVVMQPLNQRLDYLANEIGNFDGAGFADGFQGLMYRHSYIDFVSQTLQYVPDVVPHENGARLGQTILHILTPRIFFPNKPALMNDSDVTAYYTGLPLNLHRGTSISLGYLGELYVDFGRVGAWVAAFVLGMGFGYLYRILTRKALRAPLVSYGLAAMWSLGLATFGTALIKVIGSLVITFIAALVIQRFVWPLVARQLNTKRRRPVRI